MKCIWDSIKISFKSEANFSTASCRGKLEVFKEFIKLKLTLFVLHMIKVYVGSHLDCVRTKEKNKTSYIFQLARSFENNFYRKVEKIGKNDIPCQAFSNCT